MVQNGDNREDVEMEENDAEVKQDKTAVEEDTNKNHPVEQPLLTSENTFG